MLKGYFLENYKIKSETIVDLGELYKVLFRWFQNNGYLFYEKEYKDEDEPGGTKHLEIFWVAEKVMDKYVKFVIELSYLVVKLAKVEVERGGTKFTTNKGVIEFRISTYMAKDYDNSWKKTSSPGLKGMHKFYENFVIRQRLNRLEDEFVVEFNAFIDEIRSFMALHKF
jgi:hypothetical protein